MVCSYTPLIISTEEINFIPLPFKPCAFLFPVLATSSFPDNFEGTSMQVLEADYKTSHHSYYAKQHKFDVNDPDPDSLVTQWPAVSILTRQKCFCTSLPDVCTPHIKLWYKFSLACHWCLIRKQSIASGIATLNRLLTPYSPSMKTTSSRRRKQKMRTKGQNNRRVPSIDFPTPRRQKPSLTCGLGSLGSNSASAMPTTYEYTARPWATC